MPLLRVRELYDGRDAARGESSRDFVRVWSVEQLDAGSPAAMGQVLDATGIPKVGDPYIGATVAENDLGVACRRVRARHNRSNKLFLVEAQYASANWGTTLPSEGGSSAGGGGGGGGESAQQLPPGFGGAETGQGTPSASPVQIDSPVLRPSVVRYGTVKRSVVIYKDESGQAITNSAGDYFDPPVETEKGLLSMFVEQNVALYDPSVIGNYYWAVNEKPWAGGAALTWRCEEGTAERMFEEGIFFWKRSFLFVYKSDFWNPREILDIGSRYKASALAKPDKVHANGRPLARALLDLNGNMLDMSTDPPPEPKFREFNTHKVKDFGALKLF